MNRRRIRQSIPARRARIPQLPSKHMRRHPQRGDARVEKARSSHEQQSKQ